MMDRRALFGVFAAALAGAALTSPHAAAAQELHVLNWQGYGTDEQWAVELFEQQTGVKVVHDYFNSEQEMLTKLRTSPGTYDVVLINSSFTGAAAEEGLIQPIDPAAIGNFGDLSEKMRTSPYLNIDGKLYGVAWVWGVTSFAYNTGKVSPAPSSIAALWDPAHAGHVGWRDDAVEAVQLAAIATGQDMNEPADMDKIREKLMALKPQIKTFWSSEDEWNKYAAAGDFDIAVYWSGSAERSKKTFSLPVEFVIPDEGAMVFMDTLVIPKDAPNLDIAYKLIGQATSAEGQKVIADNLTQAIITKAALPVIDAKNKEIYQYDNLAKLFEKARFYPFWPLEPEGDFVVFDQVLEEYQRFLKA